MSKPLLDIIITHCNEPWEVGKPLFDMIEHQRCVKAGEFAVTLVQDGAESELPWEMLLNGYSFNVNVLTIPHFGSAFARNIGIKNTKADWIMFCDFDDMFLDLCSLNQILSQFPVAEYDIIWGRMVAEEKWNGQGISLQKVDNANFYNTDCKFYRRKFLEENRLYFDSRCPMHYEQMFNELALELTTPFRIVTLTTDFYMYLKTHRDGSMRQTMDAVRETIQSRWTRDRLTADAFMERGMDFAHKKKIAFMICAEFFSIYNPEENENPPGPSDAFLDFYRRNRNILQELSQAELDVIKDMAESETMSLIQSVYNEHKLEYYFANDTMTFEEWIDSIETRIAENAQAEDAQNEQEDTSGPVVIENEPYLVSADDYDGCGQAPEHEPRVAVYCGTYNTYQNMLASAKSLLWHTRMDKIYFLIEDDFPYELPDNGIIECINVKDQEWFEQDGPNYNNSWTHMCLMRAAFAKLIPYDKVLSLDIDVVIQEDIGCLWDIDMTDYYLAGVAEPQRQKSTADPLYINFGVVMMNLAKLRRDGLDDKIIGALNTQKFGCPEQDAFNKFCAQHIYQLPNDYNATVHSHITGECEKERIIHYAGIKFWRHFGSVKEYAIRPWGAVMERQAELNE